MYPLKFENLYYEKVWGGKGFKKFRENIDDRIIGESWDVACHPNGVSVISNGIYKGMALDELIEEKGEYLLGTEIPKDNFPLLVKILNTSEKLSVQVHPDDDYALLHEGQMGKTEIWYILDASEDGHIILGTKDCTREDFIRSIEKKNPEKCMNKIKVGKGDVFYIQSGLIHSMSGGLTIVEIQQNSDVTYRVYDYGRGRELHIDKALDVIDFNIEPKKSQGSMEEYENYNKISYCSDKNFALELFDIKKYLKESSDRERFFIFTSIEGDGHIEFDKGEEEIKLGESILIPASLGEYRIIGNLKLLKTYVPNKNSEEIR